MCDAQTDGRVIAYNAQSILLRDKN